jgi:hypothetical protein
MIKLPNTDVDTTSEVTCDSDFRMISVDVFHKRIVVKKNAASTSELNELTKEEIRTFNDPPPSTDRG